MRAVASWIAVGLLVLGAAVPSLAQPTRNDVDGDGVVDATDRCPDTPRGATVDAEGCPQDGDGDGVYDGLDDCPGTARGATVDARGCRPMGWFYDEGLRYTADNRRFSLRINNRMHVRLSAKDPDAGDSAESFDIPQYKLIVTGEAFENWRFRIQADLADGSESSKALLEDAYAEYSWNTLANLRMGQGKVYFGRQALTESGKLQFVDRSIAAEEFLPRPDRDRDDSRDVGLTALGQNSEKKYSYCVGVYNGNGTNKDEKDNSDYMAVARLLITPLGEYVLGEVDLDRPDDAKFAIGVAVMSATRGTAALEEEARDSTAGLEVAYKHRGVNLAAEFFTRSVDLPISAPSDEEDTDGWYVQGGYLFPNRHFEIAGRYSEIIRDTPDDDDETEAGVALNYYFRRHNAKLQFDYRVLEFESFDPAAPRTPEIDRNELRVQLQLEF